MDLQILVVSLVGMLRARLYIPYRLLLMLLTEFGMMHVAQVLLRWDHHDGLL